MSLTNFHVSTFFFYRNTDHQDLHSFPTRRSSDLLSRSSTWDCGSAARSRSRIQRCAMSIATASVTRSEEHTSELQSRENLVCRLLLEKKKITIVISLCPM